MSWQPISHLGALAFTGPLALFIVLHLLAGGRARLALAWCALLGAGLALVVATKIAFLGWGIGWRAGDFAGMSGHAARAAAVFPVALFLLFQGERAGARTAGVVLGMLVAALVALARVQVHAHPPSEAALGFAAGIGVAALFIARAERAAPVPLRPALVLVCVAVLAASPRREPVDAEKWIALAAMHLSGHDRTFQRWSWQLARHPWQVHCPPGETARGLVCS
jgi:membrane-associated phospholipid phosphatase